MRLRNISPLGQLDVPVLNRQGGVEFDENDLPIRVEGSGCLEPGEVFDCPDEIAGRAPTVDPETGEVTDRGSGLLAQVGVFEAAEDPEPRAGDEPGQAEPTSAPAPRRTRKRSDS